MSRWVLFEILLTSAVIGKQRLLHENEIVQYLQNYKWWDVNQSHSKNSVQDSTSATKRDYHEATHKFFTDQSVFSYRLRLNCYNFALPLQDQLKYISRECILVSQNRLQLTLLRQLNSTALSKFWKITFFANVFLWKHKALSFLLLRNIDKVFSGSKTWSKTEYLKLQPVDFVLSF